MFKFIRRLFQPHDPQTTLVGPRFSRERVQDQRQKLEASVLQAHRDNQIGRKNDKIDYSKLKSRAQPTAESVASQLGLPPQRFLITKTDEDDAPVVKRIITPLFFANDRPNWLTESEKVLNEGMEAAKTAMYAQEDPE